MPEAINNKLKIIQVGSKKYLIDEDNNVYEDTESDNVIDNNLYNNKLIKVGVYKQNQIIFDEFYKQKESELVIKENIQITNKVRSVLVDILEHDLKNKSIMDITTVDKNTLLYQRTFDKLDIVILGEIKDSKLKIAQRLAKLNNVSLTQTDDLRSVLTKKYDYVSIDSNVLLSVPIEHLCNRLSDTSKYIIIELKDNQMDINKLLNDFYFNEKHNMMVIMNDKPRNPLMKFIKDNFKTSKVVSIIEDFIKLDINSIEKLKQLVKTDNFITLEHSIKTERVESIEKKVKKVFKIKQEIAVIEEKPTKVLKKLVKKKKVAKKAKKAKKVKGSVKEDCMGNSLKDIKKSAVYKALPKSVGKSKLKKKELCDAISKAE